MLYEYNKRFDYEEKEQIAAILKPFQKKLVSYKDSKDVMNNESDFLKLFK